MRHYYWVEIAGVSQWFISTPGLASGDKLKVPQMFRGGRPLPAPGPIRSVVRQPGDKRGFMFIGAEGIPVGNERIARVFRELAPDDIQLFPLEVEGEGDPYFVVNVIKSPVCIDEANSREVRRYATDDPVPERRGNYRWIYGLRIDSSKTEGVHVFRPARFTPAFIVSEDVKTALEAVGNLGVAFQSVTAPHG
jgi:hypothetical protein